MPIERNERLFSRKINFLSDIWKSYKKYLILNLSFKFKFIRKFLRRSLNWETYNNSQLNTYTIHIIDHWLHFNVSSGKLTLHICVCVCVWSSYSMLETRSRTRHSQQKKQEKLSFYKIPFSNRKLII